MNKWGALRLVVAVNLVLLASAALAQANLFSAARTGTASEVAELLHKGSDVNSVDVNGDTPLLIAVQYNSTDVVDVLLNAGADPQYKNPNTGQTIFSLASQNPDSSAIYRLFIQRNLSIRVGPSSSSRGTQSSGGALNPDSMSRRDAESRGFTYVVVENPATMQDRKGIIDHAYTLGDIKLTADWVEKACEAVTLGILKAPSTARFPDDNAAPIIGSDGEIMYRFSVDAQNSFGAQIRSSYLCDGFIKDNTLYLGILTP